MVRLRLKDSKGRKHVLHTVRLLGYDGENPRFGVVKFRRGKVVLDGKGNARIPRPWSREEAWIALQGLELEIISLYGPRPAWDRELVHIPDCVRRVLPEKKRRREKTLQS